MKLLVDIHTHTTASGHAYSTISEYVAHAKKIGLTHFATTDHAPEMPGASGLFHFFNLDTIPDLWDNIRIYKGIELNILNIEGKVDYPTARLEALDLRIASLHPPCIKPASKEENTLATINAMKNPLIHIIGHPGAPAYPIDIPQVVKWAVDTGTYLEINNKSLEPGSIRDDRESVIAIAKECKRVGHPVVCGTDAHIHFDLANFDRCVTLLKEIDMPEELVLNTNIKKFEVALGLKGHQSDYQS